MFHNLHHQTPCPATAQRFHKCDRQRSRKSRVDSHPGKEMRYSRNDKMRIYVDGILVERSGDVALASKTTPGLYLVYLDVWERLVTYVEDRYAEAV